MKRDDILGELNSLINKRNKLNEAIKRLDKAYPLELVEREKYHGTLSYIYTFYSDDEFDASTIEVIKSAFKVKIKDIDKHINTLVKEVK